MSFYTTVSVSALSTFADSLQLIDQHWYLQFADKYFYFFGLTKSFETLCILFVCHEFRIHFDPRLPCMTLSEYYIPSHANVIVIQHQKIFKIPKTLLFHKGALFFTFLPRTY